MAIGCGSAPCSGISPGTAAVRFDSALVGRRRDDGAAGFLVAITVLAVLGPGLTNAMIAVGILVNRCSSGSPAPAPQDLRERPTSKRRARWDARPVASCSVTCSRRDPRRVGAGRILFVVAITSRRAQLHRLGVQPPTSPGLDVSTATSFMSQAPHRCMSRAQRSPSPSCFLVLGDGLAQALGTNRSAVVEK